MDPLSLALIATALFGGSSGLNAAASNKVSKEQARLRQAELERQQNMREQARNTFSNLLQSQSAETQAEEQGAQKAKLTDRYQQAVDRSRFTDLLPGQGDASAAVKADIVRSGDTGLAKALKSGMSRAALDAYGQQGLSNTLAFQGAKSALDDISGSSRASRNILPLELEGAQGAGSALRGWANLLSTAGNLAGSAAASKIFSAGMTPGQYGGETAIGSLGGRSITPSFDIYRTMPAGVSGPAQKLSWF